MAGSAYATAEPDPECAWLVGAALECGLASQGGMGLAPIAWQEIQAWATLTGEDDPWLCATLRHLSRAYVDEYHASRDPQRAAPLADWLDPAAVNAGVSHQIRQMMLRHRELGHGR